ncbi:MAG TPA: exodeoxyribonuclease VII small subunit [Spirochaetia bacterium]|nr:MAG: exodeoxyribonuclease VII small subunit [Spirochaetes bacterium GWB1_36_13]HCL57419.1 exodeoxyribonuclease VII small subunit [Spirochaetia bacterium]
MNFNFEKSLDKLRLVVEKMENQDTSLEESLSLYTEGIKLYKSCASFLETSKRKVEILKNGKEIIENPKIKPDIGLFEDIE